MNAGSARAYPTLTITGPSTGSARVYEVTNVTTGKAVYFNLTMLAGETITLNLQPDTLSMVSSFRGNVLSSVLPGSALSELFLAPGTNTVRFLAAGSTMSATLQWRSAYMSVDDASY
jgi:hypothetical protein